MNVYCKATIKVMETIPDQLGSCRYDACVKK